MKTRDEEATADAKTKEDEADTHTSLHASVEADSAFSFPPRCFHTAFHYFFSFPSYFCISFPVFPFLSSFLFQTLLPIFFSVCNKHLRQYGGVIKPISFHPQVFISLIHPPCLRSVINKVSHHENEK